MSAPLTHFEFPGGELRGSDLALHPASLVHRGAASLETLPLATVSSVRVAFERDARRLGWGTGWLLVALVLFAVAAPLAALAAAAGQELAAQHAAGTGGVAGALLGFLRFVEALAAALPFAAALGAAAGAALCALGWIGTTTLAVTFAGGERAWAVRGRSALLLAFSERLSEQILSLKR